MYIIITHFSKPNFERQKPTLGKRYKTNFFMHDKKYFRTVKILKEAGYLEP
jgi:hypothetical protein